MDVLEERVSIEFRDVCLELLKELSFHPAILVRRGVPAAWAAASGTPQAQPGRREDEEDAKAARDVQLVPPTFPDFTKGLQLLEPKPQTQRTVTPCSSTAIGWSCAFALLIVASVGHLLWLGYSQCPPCR